jgi:very-short-patch-repair endonuclease
VEDLSEAQLLPSRSREGLGVGTVDGIRRPTLRAQQLRREATPAERRLWTILSAGKMGVRSSRQMPVGPFICDFLSRSAMVAIEVDGDTHAASVDYDAERDAFLRSRGLRVIRFSNADVMGNLDGVAQAIAAALAERPTPSPSREREGSL